MPIPVHCNRCGFTFSVDARFAGSTGACPKPDCNGTYRVSASPRTSQPSSAQEQAGLSKRCLKSAAQTSPPGQKSRSGTNGIPRVVLFAGGAVLLSLGLLVVAIAGVTGRAISNRPASAAEGNSDANLAAAEKAGTATPAAGANAKAAPASEAASRDVFVQDLRPFFARYCQDCHGADEQNGGVAFHKYPDEASVLEHRKIFEKTLAMLKISAMPPDDHEPKPTADELRLVAGWLEAKLYHLDCEAEQDPGRVTIRRLNRAEYDNTIRDLVGVDFQPAADFPSDDVGNGFDNIGDVLSLPPLLMEKYLEAAEQITAKAIVADVSAAKSQRFEDKSLASTLDENVDDNGFKVLVSTGEVFGTAKIPADGDYILRAEAAQDKAGNEDAKMEFRIDGRKIQVFDVGGSNRAATFEIRTRLKQGQARFSAAFINDYYNPKARDRGDRDRNLRVRFLEISGPIGVADSNLPEVHRRLVIARPGEDKSVREAATEIFRKFATRAFRRPATGEELARIAGLVELAVEQGEPFERGVQIGMQGVLVSPHFLFRIEEDARPDDPQAKHRIQQFELASRLSYFLWSSMPDDELLDLADKGQLADPKTLQRQTRRMLQDPRSQALMDNFFSQWLNLRNLDEATPDPRTFPTFDPKLKADMRRETDLFAQSVVRENRSVLDFLDGEFTFVNQRLAEHYGFSGVKGDAFQRVSLEGTPRAGILTHASILTITSDPNRTSPVKRGKWILENLLGDSPPPPPAAVPELEETAKANPGASLRQQLEIHRVNPTCASCHKLMDPLGFGFENFDAIGRWRDRDGRFPVDASGTLPSGEEFRSARELVSILKKRDRDFAGCLAEKLLTFALGRGLEHYDRCAVRDIVTTLADDEYRFHTLVQEIVKSRPFQMRRGDGGDQP